MAIGSITNPTCFLIESVSEAHPPAWYMPFAMTSVTLTTIGYGMGAILLLRWTLADNGCGSGGRSRSDETAGD